MGAQRTRHIILPERTTRPPVPIFEIQFDICEKASKKKGIAVGLRNVGIAATARRCAEQTLSAIYASVLNYAEKLVINSVKPLVIRNWCVY